MIRLARSNRPCMAQQRSVETRTTAAEEAYWAGFPGSRPRTVRAGSGSPSRSPEMM